jgi:tetratricopeptide (TPR) repeat protein
MGVFSDRSTLAYASAVELQGLIELDLGHPQLALESFQQAYNCRAALLPANDSFLAASFVEIGLAYTEIGLAYTEIGDLEKAHEHLQRSIDIRLEAKSDRIGNSYSNMASLLLRMGKADSAEEMLKRCPSLKDFTDDTFLKTGNPRFSG